MAGLGGRAPNFDGLLDSDQPKDTQVTIVEEDCTTASGSNKRSRPATTAESITLAAHWVVLRSLSPYFQTKLERWSRENNASKRACGPPPQQQQQPQLQQQPQQQQQQQEQQQEQQQQEQQQEQPPPYLYSLQLLVPPGQLELGRRLITAMYSSSPNLSDLEAQQLVQLVALAECYGVGKVVADAAAQLHTLSVKDTPLDIAAAVFELPEACLELEVVQQVQQAAADKLQQELGDLEVVWGDEAKQQQLLGLPLGALLQLLRDERTRVASEDTAVYTAQRWLNSAQASGSKQQQQLAEVLRPQHCTSTFLASLAGPGILPPADSSWVYDSNPELLVDLLAVAGQTDREQWWMWTEMVREDKPLWRLPPRPASVVGDLQLFWDVPLREIEASLAAADDEAVVISQPTSVIWQGRCWWLSLECSFAGLPSSNRLDAFVCIGGPPVYITTEIRLHTTSSRGWYLDLCCEGSYVRGAWGGLVVEWPVDKETWPQVKAWLQQQGLVHPDGCLHLSTTTNCVL